MVLSPDWSGIRISSAGAGALGTVLLLNYSEMTPAQDVGTDPKVPANKSEELMRLVHSLRVQGLLVQAIYVARLVRETGGPLRP